MSNVIRSSIGGTEYLTVTVTEDTGAAIFSNTFQVSLGSASTPGTWVNADSQSVLTSSSVQLKVLVGANGTLNPTAGNYWLWVKITDTPEVIPIRVGTVTIA